MARVTCQCGQRFSISEVNPKADFDVADFKKKGLTPVFLGGPIRCPGCSRSVNLASAFNTPQTEEGKPDAAGSRKREETAPVGAKKPWWKFWAKDETPEGKVGLQQAKAVLHRCIFEEVLRRKSQGLKAKDITAEEMRQLVTNALCSEQGMPHDEAYKLARRAVKAM
jgi:hypothetical protein